MKSLINFLAYPQYSFTLIIGFFFFIIKYPQHFASIRFLKITSSLILLFFLYLCSDPNFFKIISLADNVPILFLNGLFFFFLWYSFYKAHKNDQRTTQGLEPIEALPENREKVWVWPHLVYVELLAMMGAIIFLLLWALFLKAPLEEPADLSWAPNPAKAPWYFLGLQEMLVYFDPWIAGILIPGLIVVGLIAIPYIDTNPKGSGYFTFKERKTAISIWVFGWLVLWVYLIQVGTFLRGPNWTFYGPMEYWDKHKVVSEANVNFSEVIWIKLFRQLLPQNLFLRELPGIIFVLLYILGGYFLIKKVFSGKEQQLGSIRYKIFVFLLLMLGSLPLKMYLRWLFNLKYIIALPELELSI